MEGLPLEQEYIEEPKEAAFESLRTGVEKWGRILAFAAFMSGSASEVVAKEKPKTIESSEYKNREKVNELCHKNGFTIVDAHSEVMDVSLPREEVKHVILMFGQIHAGGSYDKMSKVGRATVIQSQQTIFKLLESAHTKTGKTVDCLHEGVTSEENAKAATVDPKTFQGFINFSRDVSKANESIEKIANAELNNVTKFVETKVNESDKIDIKNSTLFDMSVAARSLLQQKNISSYERERLTKLSQSYESHIDSDRLTYKLGGAAIAARLGYAHIRPADNLATMESIYQHVYNDLGMTPHLDELFYDVLARVPAKKKKDIDTVIAKYATSALREVPVLQGAEAYLKDKEVVVLVYGDGHTFSESFKHEYDAGHMKNTALVKISTKFVQSASPSIAQK